jgi:transglutaminase/protease-like cytokinesis protein 3
MQMTLTRSTFSAGIKSILPTFALCVFSMQVANAQNQNTQIDAYAQAFSVDKSIPIETFALTLAKPYTTDYDKARVLFAWIGTHIRYDFKKLENLVENNFKTQVKGTSKEDNQRKFEEMKETATMQCFKSKKGVCEDYSRLYKKMCDAIGLECEVVTGTAKMLSQNTKGMNHAWNVVKIGGKWQLLDATWGAGYAEDESFKQYYSDGFFAVEPRFFILNHLPYDDKWQFLDKTLSKETFKKQPWVNYGQKIAPIKDVQPLETALKTEAGKATIKIQFAEKAIGLKLFSPGRKPIAHTESQKEGYTYLTFDANSFPFVYVNILKPDDNSQLQTIAKFYIEQN